MPDIIDMVDFFFVSAGLTIAIMGLALSFRSWYMDSWTKSFFLVFFALLTVYTASDLISQLSLIFFGQSYALLSKIAVFIESLSSSLLMPLLTIYMMHLCGEDLSLKSRFYLTVIMLWTAYTLLLVFTQFTEYIYYISDDNVYHRGPLYPVLLIPPILIMLTNLYGLYQRRRNLSRSQIKAFLIYFLVPAFSMLIQMAVYGILMIVLGTAVSSLIMFIIILDDQMREALEQQRKLAEQQLRIRTLQMRPHFVYNTLTNIYYLCELDPKKAQRVLDDFSTYLRKNFSAVVKQGLIPFADELEHTEAFLAVVKARYEYLLFVEYNIEYNSFKIPPLTLEPIVENAVKHSLDPEAGPLHIFISTRKTENGCEMIIENTGKQFSLHDIEQIAHPDDDEPHIGLNNVSERLRQLCGGTLEVSAREGGGTVVTIKV